MLSCIEKQLKRRFAIGSQVSEHSIIQDFTKQVGLPWGRLGGGEGAGGLLVAAVAQFPPAQHWCSFLSRQAFPRPRPLPSFLPLGLLQSGAGCFFYPIVGEDRRLGFCWIYTHASPSPCHRPFPHCLGLVGLGGAEPGGEVSPLIGDGALDPIEQSWLNRCFGELVIFKISGTVLVSGLGFPFMYFISFCSLEQVCV